MLLPRVLTAAVGIPLLLLLIHLGGLAFSLFSVAIAILCLYEYALILRLGGKPIQPVGTVLAGAAFAACTAFDGPLSLVCALCVAGLTLREMFGGRSLERVALSLFGAVFFGWMPAHLALVRDLPNGEAATFMLFVSVWLMDTCAYFVGKKWGQHALSPSLSPKKTWEGAAAGFIAALIVIFIFRRFALPEMSFIKALALGIAVGVAGQLSDLAESMVKRAVGAKDSGALLPGHGGVMDRFDSYILCAPAVYYCILLL